MIAAGAALAVAAIATASDTLTGRISRRFIIPAWFAAIAWQTWNGTLAWGVAGFFAVWFASEAVERTWRVKMHGGDVNLLLVLGTLCGPLAVIELLTYALLWSRFERRIQVRFAKWVLLAVVTWMVRSAG